MEWVKTLHLFGVIGWMAGVFYMPRLLVNIVEAHNAGEPILRLEGMALRLFRFCAGLAVIGLGAGLWLWLGYGYQGAWLHAKLAFVVLLVIYYAMSYVWLREMMRGTVIERPPEPLGSPLGGIQGGLSKPAIADDKTA